MTRLAFVLAAVLLAAVTAPASAADLPLSERHVMSVGHADVINVRPEDGRLLVDVTDDSGDEPVQRRPGDVLLHAKPESQLTVPDDPAYAFLGAPDDPVWIMPEVQDNGLLWPGWNTMAVSATEFPDAMLTMRLLDLRGPDELSVFTSGPMGEPNIIFDTGHPLPQAAPIFNRSHTHVNWAFEAEGVYRMTVEVLGVRADGQTVSTGPITYTWFVGDLANLPADVTLSVTGMEPAYQAGATVALAASQEPDTGFTDLRWSSRCGDAAAWTPAGGAPALTFAAEPGLDGCTYRVALHAPDGTEHAVSEPVALHVVPRAPDGSPPPPAATGTAPEPVALRARVSGSRLRLGAVRRAGALRLRCRLDGAGTCAARASIAAAAARRLGLRVPSGAEQLTIGSGSATLRAAGGADLRVVLNRRGRTAMRRGDRRLRVRLAVTTTGRGRPRATSRTSVMLTR